MGRWPFGGIPITFYKLQNVFLIGDASFAGKAPEAVDTIVLE
jgi:hypothetical protein